MNCLSLLYMQDKSYQLLQLLESIAVVFVNGSGWNPALRALAPCWGLLTPCLWAGAAVSQDPLPGPYGMLSCAYNQPGWAQRGATANLPRRFCNPRSSRQREETHEHLHPPTPFLTWTQTNLKQMRWLWRAAVTPIHGSCQGKNLPKQNRGSGWAWAGHELLLPVFFIP